MHRALLRSGPDMQQARSHACPVLPLRGRGQPAMACTHTHASGMCIRPTQPESPGGVRVHTDATYKTTRQSHPRATSSKLADMDHPMPMPHIQIPAHARAKDHGGTLSKM
ncbi:hypothetical protein JB92DRAFT_2830923 [Gautieria morchelliformis]|nr:hypothetical protein JB92DRAFT_2830923 [Gautieria morchelliformis]